ncbi:hypothetical protein GCM10018953_32360 [Streptosporangium nondiastaticum]
MNALATTSLGRVPSQCRGKASECGDGVVSAAVVMPDNLVTAASPRKENGPGDLPV